jgi:hypothetical protein
MEAGKFSFKFSRQTQKNPVGSSKYAYFSKDFLWIPTSSPAIYFHFTNLSYMCEIFHKIACQKHNYDSTYMDFKINSSRRATLVFNLFFKMKQCWLSIFNFNKSGRPSLPAKSAGQVCRPSLPAKSAGQVCRPSLPAKSARQVCQPSRLSVEHRWVTSSSVQ